MLGMVRTWIVWESLIASNDATWWGGPHWTVSEVENNVAIVSWRQFLSCIRSD